jgi:hypothetical protein
MNPRLVEEIHKSTCKKCLDIVRRKSNDYCGGSEMTDALLNFRSATALGLHPVTGILLRMQDKIMRLQSFTNDGDLQVKGESVMDSCDDLVNYAILIKCLFIEEGKFVDQD